VPIRVGQSGWANQAQRGPGRPVKLIEITGELLGQSLSVKP
jgi:hypothetical protein